MSEPKKKLSGHQYKKRRETESKKEAELLSKVKKCDTYFGSLKSSTKYAVKEKISADEVVKFEVDEDTEMHDLLPGSSVSMPIREEFSHEALAEDLGNNILQNYNDPANWIINESTRDYIALHGVQKNTNVDFRNSKRVYGDSGVVRYCSEELFKRKLKNGETTAREWLAYSESKGSVFCVPCLVFGDKSNSFSTGFNDWKNGAVHVEQHERSHFHRSCLAALKLRETAKRQVDSHVVEQLEGELHYWRNILRRVCSTLKYLTIDEKVGSLKNCNYLGLLEVIAVFDPFLADHIKSYRKAGSGNTAHLSKTVCEEFIKLINEKLITKIVDDVKKAKYFGIIIDSSPDLSHVDQLTFIIRYVKEEGIPVERFLGFIPNAGHKSKNLKEAVLSTLERHQLDIKDCRGQSYDNAVNMSGAYARVQARIKQLNPLAQYVPCAAHTLNLVGSYAAECCKESSSFYSTLQLLYNFFTESTYRWGILMSCMEPGACVVKHLSQSHWSARHNVCQTLRDSWSDILKALKQISDDRDEKEITQNTSKNIYDSINRLETALMASMWGTILQQFQVESMKLQHVETDLGTVTQVYKSLKDLITIIRDNFDHYEQLAKSLSGLDEYEFDHMRKNKEFHLHQTGRDHFRINSFSVVLDRLHEELTRRSVAYNALYERFSFLENLHSLSIPEITTCAANLLLEFKEDLEDCFTDECIHLHEQLKVLVENTTIPLSLIQLCKLLWEKDLQDIYVNVYIVLRMFLSSPVTNCSGERSFSSVRRVKHYLRSPMVQEHLNTLSLLTIEGELFNEMDCEDLINAFAEQKCRSNHLH